MRTISLDTETFLIGPGSIAPKLVCFTTAERVNGNLAVTLVANGDASCESMLRSLLMPGHRLVFHNAAYDLAVIARSYPALEELVWEKLDAGEVSDTKIREQLLNLSTHGHLETVRLPDGSSAQIKYHLATLAMAYLGVDRSQVKTASDSWRLNFNTLDGLRADQFPADAANYAKDDAQDTLLVFEAQEQRVQTEDDHGSLATECFHAAADFALFCMTIEGMRVDPARFEKCRAELEELTSEKNLSVLVEAGILTPSQPARPYANMGKKVAELLREWTGADGADPLEWRAELELAGVKFKDPEPSKVSMKDLRARVADLCARAGLTVKETQKGEVSTDSEVVDDLVAAEERLGVEPAKRVFAAFQKRQEVQKMLTTELPRLCWEGKVAERVHANFKVLVETGRTSSFAGTLFPSFNGQNVDPRARPIYVPDEKHLFCSVDYSALELVCVAQTTFDLFGASVHRDKINDGYDLHAFLGANIAATLSPEFHEAVRAAGANASDPEDAYGVFMGLKGSDLFKFWRKLAKPVGLGFPGGLGPWKMLTLAKKTYGVDFVTVAMERVAKGLDHPEPNGSVIHYAKKLFGMEEDAIQWNPVLHGIWLASRLRELWLRTYPEMAEYFEWIQTQVDEHNSGRVAEDEDGVEREVRSLCYTSPMGMHRANCTFTAAANGRAMQTPAAEGAKAAVFNVVRAARDPAARSILYRRCTPRLFIHDEILSQLPEAEAHELAREKQRVMEESMRLVITDVRVKTEAALMRRWHKEAEPVLVDGRLVPWEPKP